MGACFLTPVSIPGISFPASFSPEHEHPLYTNVTFSRLATCRLKNGGLANNQVEWHRDWRGSKVHVVKSVTEALAVLGLMPTTDIEHRGPIG